MKQTGLTISAVHLMGILGGQQIKDDDGYHSELIDDELMVLCGPVVGLQFLTQLRNPLELLRLFSCVLCK